MVALVVLFAGMTVSTSAFAAGQVTSSTVPALFDTYNSVTGQWNELKTSQHRLNYSQVVYCLQHKKEMPWSESYNTYDVLSNYSYRVKNGLLIILTNGYPWETNGLSASQAEYATANAIRFWLSECGDAQFYNQTNLGDFSDYQLRVGAASGLLSGKIRTRSTSYRSVLQFSIELLIKARNQSTIYSSISASPENVSAARSGNNFIGSARVYLNNLRSYTINTSSLPYGSSVVGNNGYNGDTIYFSIPASASTANRTYSVTISGLDDRALSSLKAYNHASDSTYQRVLAAYIGSSYYTAVTTRTLTITTGTYETPKPDLTITSISTPQNSYAPGDSISMTVTVKNQGQAASNACYLMLKSADGQSASSKVISSLAVGATKDITFTLTAPTLTASNVVQYIATADSTNLVDESNESNNTYNKYVAVIVPKHPDLVVTALSANKTGYTTGESMSITVTVANQGEKASGAFSTSISGDEITTKTISCSSLGVGASATYTLTLTAPSTPQVLYLTAFADSGYAVAESNEDNNTRRTAARITQPVTYPDLVISALLTDKTSYAPGETITVTAVTKNQGQANAGGFYVSAKHDAANTAGYSYIDSLNMNAVKVEKLYITAPNTPQTLTITATADAFNGITESDETNNTRTCQVTVVAVPQPDLIVTSVTPNKSSYNAGETVIVYASIKNQGDASSGTCMVQLTPEGMSAQSTTIVGLAAGSSQQVSFAFTAPVLAADAYRTLTVFADSTNVVAESNESNNTGTGRAYIIGSKPDIEVVSLATNAAAYAPGELVTVAATVRNNGLIACPASSVRLSINSVGALTNGLPSIAPGSSRDMSFTFYAPSSEGQFAITAYADPDNTIAETNEYNNSRATAIKVVDPTLTKLPDVTLTATNATNWYAGKDVVVTATLANNTEEDIPVVTVRLYLAGRNYEETVPLPGNGTNIAVFRVTLPATTGSVQLSFTADPHDTLVESDESNNALSRTITISNAPTGVVLDPDLPQLETYYKQHGVMSVPNTTGSTYHTWQEVRLEGESYITRTFWAQLQTTFQISPDPRVAYSDKPRVIESGFGVQCSLRTTLTTNYDHPEKLVGAQLAHVYSPENGYSTVTGWESVFDNLEVSSGSAGGTSINWQFARNPHSETNSRLHYIPLWFPDGNYTLLSKASYAWTPAGQLYGYATSNVQVSGDMYDRVTAIQGR